ncbi:MAG: hypothetical protein IAI49_13815 [Candidatus Eremiobacteraeota bacterium]|nr:hypothetical protein [Candidatus Eremiobacteraeota bacterium]
MSAAACALAAPRRARADGLGPEAIFARAKDAWRARSEVPFVTFSLRERYLWRATTHDNWWHVAYRAADGGLALTRLIVPEDEAKRMRGVPISLNFRWHHGAGRADSLDTSSDADAFPILDPLIEPNAAFGLLHREQKPVLALDGRSADAAAPRPEPSPSASPAPAADAPLRELAHVEAVSRDYAIAVAGTERIRGADAYHLTLTPLRLPNVNRLRDLWIDATTFETAQLAVHGLFDGKPYQDARWLVSYVELSGRGYVQQIRTEETLRFGLDRFVTGLAYDFVSYDFPSSLPPLAFERLL